jgi:Cys-tRNA(Pro) deacylase
MEDDKKKPLIVLMHGDRQVSTQKLARLVSARNIDPCVPETAKRYSGYLVGGTSPFGTCRPMPVYMEESILLLDKIYINGGKRGFLVGMRPEDAQRLLSCVLVNVAV